MLYVSRIFILSLFFFSALSGCSDPDFLERAKIDGSILMGTAVETSDPIAKRTVMIAQNFNWFENEPQYFGLCTGVVLNPTTVITAAHCMTHFEKSKVIQTNNIYLNENQFYDVKTVVIHDKYTESKDSTYDIALIQLNRALTNIDVIETEFPLSNSNGLIAGFGKNTLLSPSNLKPLTGLLEKAAVVIPDELLLNRFIQIDQNEKSGVCSGDSGGPLFINRDGKLHLQAIAIQVSSKKCTGYGTYLNLDFFKDWIQTKSVEFYE